MQNDDGTSKKHNDTSPQLLADVPENTGSNRDGDDESLAHSSPNDARSDEKVIVNEQRSNKTINTPSQSAANTSENTSTDEEIVDNP